MQLLKNLNLILLFSFLFIYCYIYLNNFETNSKYSLGENTIIAKITSIKKDDKKLTLELISKEKLYGYIYLDRVNINLKIGDIVLCKGVLTKPSENTNFNLFNFKKYLLSKKIHYIFNIESIKKIKETNNVFYKLKNYVINKIEKLPKKEYFYTFLLGDTSYIKEDTLKKYRNLGISHLLAISGMHVSLITSFLKKNKITFIISIILLSIYAFLTNFTPSILRALLFYIFSSLKLFNIDIKSSKYIYYTLALLLFINPGYIYNLGFIFSFTISFFLINIKVPKNKLKASIYISVIAFLSSIPILLINFFEINILTIIFNLFFVPFISFIFILTIISFFIPLFLNIVIILISILEFIINICSSIPSTIIFHKMNIIISIFYYIVLYMIVKNKIKKSYFLIPVIFYFFSNFRFNNTITMIDVEQGDSTLIELKNGKNILIDTGGIYNKNNYSDYNVVPYLKSKGINKIDYLILTHGDYDHIGESINIINNFKVKKVIFNIGSYNELELNLIKKLKEKNISYYNNISYLNIEKNILYFLNTNNYNDENENSLVIYTKIDSIKLLFMGDAGIEKEKDILEKYNLKDIDFIKIGHHGSNTSSSEEFINSINPRTCLISVGKNNRYNHPNDEVINRLNNYCNIYRTDINGSTKIILDKNNYKIKAINY